MTLDQFLSKLMESVFLLKFWFGALILFVLLVFRTQCGRLLDRIVEFKGFGFLAKAGPHPQPLGAARETAEALAPSAGGAATNEAIAAEGAAPPTPTVVEPAGNSPEQNADRVLAEANDPSFVEQEELVDQHLAEIGVAGDATQTVRVLRRYVSGWKVVADFERIYGLIWQSQLNLLRALNANEAQAKAQARALYDHYEANPTDERFRLWLEFLTRNDLARETADDRLLLTRKGHSFLLFLVRNGKRDPLN